MSVVFMFIVAHYSAEVSSARLDYLFSDIYNYSSYGYDSYYSSYSSSSEYEDLTFDAAIWSMLFFLLFIAIDLLGLLKVKTKTTKTLSIIGLSISAIFLFWNFAVMSSPGAMSFDEVSPGWMFYSLIVLAFSIIGLVQSIRYQKKLASPTVSNSTAATSDLLDS